MSSPWDAFPLVGKAKTPSSSPWDAFPLVNTNNDDADYAAEESRNLNTRELAPDEYAASQERQQQLRQRMAPPVIEQPSDEYAPVDPAKQYARFSSLRAMPSNQGINDADLQAQAQMELQPWEVAAEQQKDAAWKAKQDAQLGYQPQFERPLENVSDEFARNLTGQPNIQNQPPQQQPIPTPRKMGNPQEQAMYDAAYQDVLAQLQAREGENYQANQKRVNEQAVYRDMPGQQLPPVLREIGSGLARTGTGVAAAGGMVADMISGETDYAKDWSQTGSNIARETENKAREQGGEGAAFASRNASGIVQSLATNMIAAPAGKIAQYAAGGLTSAGDAYGEARELGLDRNQSALYAVVNGALEGGSEFVAGKVGLGGMEDVLAGERKIAMKQGLGAAIKTIAKSGLAEGTTELPVSAAQEIARQVFSDGRADTAKTPEEWAKLFTDSFVQGFGGGAAAHGTQLVDAIEKAGLSKDVLKYGSASRKILDAIPESILPKHLREKMSQSDRIDMVKELRKRAEEQPELKTADPSERVGSEFAEPIQDRPSRSGTTEAEFNKQIEEHDSDVRKNTPEFRTPDPFGSVPPQASQEERDAMVSAAVRMGLTREAAERQVDASLGVQQGYTPAPDETQLSPENAAARLGQEQAVRQSDDPSQSQFQPEQARAEYQDQSFKRDSEKVFEDIETEQRPLRQTQEAQQAKVAEQAQTQDDIEKALSEAGEEQKNPRLMEIKQETIAEGKRKGWSKKKVEQVIANRATELPAAERRSEGKPAAIDFDVDRDKFNIDEVNKKDRADMSGDEAKWLLGRSELTGLRNKRAYAESERRATTPYKSSIDINGLKQLNDRFGHGAGDDLIKQVGAVLKAQKALDIYHFSGDEFVARGSDEKSFGDSMRNLEQELLKQKVQFRGSDGKIYTLDGIRLGYGVAPTMEQAEQELSNAKAEQERKGNRELRSSWEQRFKSDPSALPKHVYERRSTPRSGSEGGKAETDKQYLAAPATPGAATQKPSKPVSRFEHIIPEIRKRLLGSASPMSIGGMNKKDAKGYFDQHQNVVRVKGAFAGDIHTIAHEAAHSVDKLKNLVNTASPAIKAELGKMDYDLKRADPKEGFAEFVYDYLSNNGQRSPTAKAWFERVLASNKKLGGDIAYIKNLVEQYQGQSPEDKAGADQQKKFNETPETRDKSTRRRDFLTYVAGAFFDRLAGSSMAEAKAAKQLGKTYKATESIRQIMRDGQALIQDTFENGPKNQDTGKRYGPGINDVMDALGDTSEKNMEQLSVYAEAKRILDNLARGKKANMDKAQAQAIVDKYDKMPNFVAAQQKLVQHAFGMLDYMVDMGYISKSDVDAMKKAEPNYVRFKRVMEPDAFDDAIKAGNGGSPFKAFEGSGRQIKSIWEATLEQDAHIMTAAAKAAAIKSFIPYTKHADMGWLIQEVDNERGSNIMRVYHDGKYRYYEFDPATFHSLNRTFNPWSFYHLSPKIAKWLARPATLKRLGSTALSPVFAITNFMRDTGSGLMNTEGSALTYIPNLLYGTSMAAGDAMSRLAGGDGNKFGRMLRDLGVNMTSMSKDMASYQGAMKDLINKRQDKGWKNTIAPRNFLKSIEDAIGFAEMGPRIAELIQIADKHGYSADDFEAGKPFPPGVRQAIGNAASRVTLDFGQGGGLIKALNPFRAFTNVAWQGPYQMVQRARENPVRYATRGMITSTLPMLALWMQNRDEEKYKGLEPYEKMFFWNFKWGDRWVQIPRADGFSVIFAGIPEMMLNKAYSGKKGLQGELYKLMPGIRSVSPDVLTPTLEILLNENWAGKPIVPETMSKGDEAVRPEDRFREDTTDIAKAFGRGLGMSPLQIEHAARGHFGGMGRDVIRAVDEGNPMKPLENKFLPKHDRSSSVDELYKETQAEIENINSAKLHGGKPDESRIERLKDVRSLMGKINTNSKQAVAAGEMTREEYRSTVQNYVSGLADYALGNEKTKAYPLPDAAAPEAVKDAFADYVIQLVDQTRRKMGKLTLKEILKDKTPEQKRQEVIDSIRAAKKDLQDLGIDMEKARELIISRKTGIVSEAKRKLETLK